MPEDTNTSRRSILRAASGAIVAGSSVAGTAAASGKGGKGKKKKKICHCPPGREGSNCKTLYLPKKAAKKHVEKHPYDHWGACSEDEKKKGKKKRKKKEDERKEKKDDR